MHHANAEIASAEDPHRRKPALAPSGVRAQPRFQQVSQRIELLDVSCVAVGLDHRGTHRICDQRHGKIA